MSRAQKTLKKKIKKKSHFAPFLFPAFSIFVTCPLFSPNIAHQSHASEAYA